MGYCPWGCKESDTTKHSTAQDSFFTKTVFSFYLLFPKQKTGKSNLFYRYSIKMLIFPFTLKGIALFDILFSKFITINSTSFLYSSFALFIYATIYKAYKKNLKANGHVLVILIIVILNIFMLLVFKKLHVLI